MTAQNPKKIIQKNTDKILQFYYKKQDLYLKEIDIVFLNPLSIQSLFMLFFIDEYTIPLNS